MFQSSCALPARGYWFAPTFFTGVSQSSRIAQEEIFGPVLSVLTFRTPEEALEKANNTPYGLQRRRLDGKGLAHSQDGVRSSAPASSGRTPTTNSIRRRRSAAIKESGFGREGGLHGLGPYVVLS